MKKFSLFIALCLVVATASAENTYPESSRFKRYVIEDSDNYVIRDTKTGCEYLGDVKGGVTLIVGTCKAGAR